MTALGIDAEAPAQVRPRRHQLVAFRRTDPLLGGDVTGLGVVTNPGGDGEPVTVRPLDTYAVQVDPAAIRPATADDVAAG